MLIQLSGLLLLLHTFVQISFGNGKELTKEFYNNFPVGIVCREAEKVLPPIAPIPLPGLPAPTDRPTNPDETVQCVIEKNNVLIFNESMKWEDREKKGYFGDANSSWDNANISVTMFWTGDPISINISTKLKSGPTLNCSAVLFENSKHRGDTFTLRCDMKMKIRMTEDQYKSTKTTWYQNCEEISTNDETFQFIEGEIEDGYPTFKRLQITNASYMTTPGKYHCTVEYKGTTMAASSYDICLQEKMMYSNRLSIVKSKPKYLAEPGEDLDVYCRGNTGKGSVSKIFWHRNTTEICRSEVNGKSENCSSELYGTKYCTSLTESVALKIQNQKANDNFTTKYTFRNIDFSDQGTYICTLKTTADEVEDSFEVVVAYPERRHKKLIIVWISLAVCIFIAFILSLIYWKFWTEIRYLWKKSFGKSKKSDKLLAYLVYMPDAFNDDVNVLDDVLKYFKGTKKAFHDPNRAPNEISATIGNDFRCTLENCLRMIVIVTPELIEQNDIEIFKTYEGLNESVQKDLRVIFVCSKETKKALIARAKEKDNVAVTVRKFMKKQGNTSITWKKNKTKRMNRALYVALPNIETTEESEYIVQNSGYDDFPV